MNSELVSKSEYSALDDVCNGRFIPCQMADNLRKRGLVQLVDYNEKYAQCLLTERGKAVLEARESLHLQLRDTKLRSNIALAISGLALLWSILSGILMR